MSTMSRPSDRTEMRSGKATRAFSAICAILGFISIIVSLSVWFYGAMDAAVEEATTERLSLFVGLWPPTFFAMAAYFYLIGSRARTVD